MPGAFSRKAGLKTSGMKIFSFPPDFHAQKRAWFLALPPSTKNHAHTTVAALQPSIRISFGSHTGYVSIPADSPPKNDPGGGSVPLFHAFGQPDAFSPRRRSPDTPRSLVLVHLFFILSSQPCTLLSVSQSSTDLASFRGDSSVSVCNHSVVYCYSTFISTLKGKLRRASTCVWPSPPRPCASNFTLMDRRRAWCTAARMRIFCFSSPFWLHVHAFAAFAAGTALLSLCRRQARPSPHLRPHLYHARSLPPDERPWALRRSSILVFDEQFESFTRIKLQHTLIASARDMVRNSWTKVLDMLIDECESCSTGAMLKVY